MKQEIIHGTDGWATVDFISEQPGNWPELLRDAEIVFGWPPPDAVEQSNLRFIQLPSSGFEPYMTEALKSKPAFRLANARGVTADAVAEHCIGMMFALIRQLPMHVRQQEQHFWKRADHYELLTGKSIAIVGLGAIGSALASRCSALGMRVIGIQRRLEAPECISELYRLDDLCEGLRNAQHVALTIAAPPQEAPLFGTDAFHAMPPGSYFYNLSRASLVSEDALKFALHEGHLRGAGLDVFEREPLPTCSDLWDFENVLITPHVGGRFDKEIDNLAGLFVHNLRQYRDGGSLKNVVLGNS